METKIDRARKSPVGAGESDVLFSVASPAGDRHNKEVASVQLVLRMMLVGFASASYSSSRSKVQFSSAQIYICSDCGRLAIEPTSLVNAELMRNIVKLPRYDSDRDAGRRRKQKQVGVVLPASILLGS